MNRKRWLLVLLVGLLVVGYLKLFYKTLDLTTVPRSADNVICIDVKRVTNTLIWQFVTTPSQWKLAGKKSTADSDIAWRDMIDIPDYLFAFHVKGQDNTKWYTILNIKDEGLFANGLLQEHFEKKDSAIYVNAALGIQLYKKNEKILVSNWGTANDADIPKIINELFVQKAYMAKESLQNMTASNSHAVMLFSANKYVDKESIITINFDKEKIELQGNLTPTKQLDVNNQNFAYAADAMFEMGITQPSPSLYALLDVARKKSISTALNMNMDSLMIPSNKYYQLSIAGIVTRMDSAISYAFDDDFNKVEKVVVNQVEEPAVLFSIAGDSTANIFNYLVKTKKVEPSGQGNLFIPMPFVKSYCIQKSNSVLQIASKNYAKNDQQKNTNCILFVSIAFAKIPTTLRRYMPDAVQSSIANVATVDFVAKKESKGIFITAIIQKKNNDKPLFDL